MYVPDDIRKCIVYVYYDDDRGARVPCGSGFFAAVKNDDGSIDTRVITARHVIDGIRERGSTDGVYLRMNNKLGGWSLLHGILHDWFTHPTDASIDVAVLELRPPELADCKLWPMEGSTVATAILREEFDLGLGEEVVVTGLFQHHYGQAKNTPIVRIWNVAAFADEPIDTGFGGGPIRGHLIEARSTGGLSGSPVFLSSGLVRWVDDKVEFAPSKSMLALLGLMHGHFQQQTGVEPVNAGIGIVVPVESIIEVLRHPDLVGKRHERESSRPRVSSEEVVFDDRIDFTYPEAMPRLRRDGD